MAQSPSFSPYGMPNKGYGQYQPLEQPDLVRMPKKPGPEMGPGIGPVPPPPHLGGPVPAPDMPLHTGLQPDNRGYPAEVWKGGDGSEYNRPMEAEAVSAALQGPATSEGQIAPPSAAPPPAAPPAAGPAPSFQSWYGGAAGLDPHAQLASAYQTFLGREGSEDEYSAHLQNPGGLETALRYVATSPEHEEYAARLVQEAAQPQAQRAVGNVLPGWDATKWANPEHNTPKYRAGRLMSQYNTQDEGERNALIQALLGEFKGSTFDGKDALYIPELGPKGIDIFGNASGGEYRPQWIDLNVEEQGAGPGAALYAPTQGMPGSLPSTLNVTDPNWANPILQQLMQQVLRGRQ